MNVRVNIMDPEKSVKSSACGTSCGFSNDRVVEPQPFAGRLRKRWPNGNRMPLDDVRSEIERMRAQVNRQRGEIRQLQRAGIPTTSAEALLERMLDRVDLLCAEARGSDGTRTRGVR